MTSQVSFNKLVKEDFRHRRWMLILSIAVQVVLGPLFMMMSLLSDYLSLQTSGIAMFSAVGGEEVSLGERFFSSYTNMIGAVYGAFGVVIAIVGAVIVGVAGYAYLFSKKKMDLYGSIPVSRGQLFMSTFVNGAWIWFVPFAGTTLINILIAVVVFSRYGFGAAAAVEIVKYTGFIILAFLSAYCAVVLAVTLSGHPFVAIVNSIVIGVDAFLIWVGLSFFEETCRSTIVYASVGVEKIAWLSPFVSAAAAMAEMTENNYKSMIMLMVGTVAITAATFTLSYIFYKKRKSELAENGVDNKVFFYVIRILTSVAAGVFAALYFSVLGGIMSVWCFFGAFIGSFAAFGVLNIILTRSGKNFFRNWPIMISTTAGTIIILLFVIFDVAGFDSYVPKKEQIVSAEIYFNQYGDDSRYMDGFEIDTMFGNMDSNMIGAYTCTDVEKIYQLISEGAKDSIGADKANRKLSSSLLFSTSDYAEDGYYSYEHFLSGMNVAIHLKNGKTVYRRYRMYDYNSELINEIVTSEDYLKAYYAGSAGYLGYPDAVVIPDYESMYYSEDYCTNREYIELLMDAYEKDFREHTDISYQTYDDFADDFVVLYGKKRCVYTIYSTYERTLGIRTFFETNEINDENIALIRETLKDLD